MIYELRISLNVFPGPVIDGLYDVLSYFGVRASEVVENHAGRESYLTVYFNSRLKAQYVISGIKKLGIKGISLRINVLRDMDWKTKWKEGLKAFNITDKTRIMPVYVSESQDVEEHDVYIDTDVVFGSGLHPTTRFMAELIEAKEGKFTDFFDIGTGSGLLCVIACKSGAGKIWAVDISSDAVETAEKNMAINGCKPDLIRRTDISKFRKKREFDLVAANLLTQDLVDMQDKIISYVRPGKYLAVSGVSEANYKTFRRNFGGKNLRCLNIKKGKGWCAVLFMRRR